MRKRSFRSPPTCTGGCPMPPDASTLARAAGQFWQTWLDGTRSAGFAFAVAVVVLVVFASTASDAFLTERNLVNVARQMVTNGLLGIGMLIVILSGGIDL